MVIHPFWEMFIEGHGIQITCWKWIHDHPPQQRIWAIPRLTMALIWGYRIFFYHWILYWELSSMSVENVLGSLILDEENKNWYMVSGHGSRHFCTNGLSKVMSFHFQPSNVEGWSFWLIILTHTHLVVEQNCRAFTKKQNHLRWAGMNLRWFLKLTKGFLFGNKHRKENTLSYH